MEYDEVFAHGSEAYPNDHFQSRLVLALSACAAILSVLLIVWAVRLV
jgi:hypothetical protein